MTRIIFFLTGSDDVDMCGLVNYSDSCFTSPLFVKKMINFLSKTRKFCFFCL